MACKRDHLAHADQHIRTTKRHIYNQERLIERLAAGGQSTDDAFVLLDLLTTSLRLFEQHRFSFSVGLHRENDRDSTSQTRVRLAPVRRVSRR
jgi:hypothetical protein